MNNYVVIFDYKQADYDEDKKEFDSPIVWANADEGKIIFDSLEEAIEIKEKLEGQFPSIRYTLYQLTEVTEWNQQLNNN